MTGSTKARRLRPSTLAALLLLPLAIGLQWLSARSPELVETLYSRVVFPPLVAALSSSSSRLPFSLAEIGLACAGPVLVLVLIWTGRALLRGKGHRWQILARTGVVGLLVAGAVYALFLIAWGLNYQRASLGRSAGLPVRPSDRSELAALSADLVNAANRLRDGLPEDEHGAMRLAGGPRVALSRAAPGVAALINRFPWLPRPSVNPKPAWASPLLARLGIGGFYSPLTAEATVNVEIPSSEVPFSAAHEVAHQLGFAREDEANYLACLVCRLHPDADFRYSGAFVASRHVQRALSSVDRAEARVLESRRSPAVRRDMAALATWVARYRGPAMTAFNRANDAYLRTQGQKDGTRSYGRMVDLLLAERRLDYNPPAPLRREDP